MGKAAIPFGSQTKLIGGTTIVAANGKYITLDSSNDCKNLSITTSVAASALTIAIKTDAATDATALDVVNIAFRSATAATGTYPVRVVTGALSLVVTSTLGQQSAVAGHLYVYLIDNAGTPEVAVSSTLYSGNSIVTTLAEGGGGGATSPTAIYSTTARSNVAIKLIGRMLQTQATAGTWASNMTTISLGNSFPFTSLWTSYTPTLGTGYGTATSVTFKYRRNFQVMEIIGRFTTGTTSNATAAIGLPAGFTIDTTAIATGSGVNSVAGSFVSGFTAGNGLAMDPADVNNLYPTGAASIDNTFTGGNIGNTQKVALHAWVPIAEWLDF